MRYVDPAGLALLIEWTQEEANGGRFLFLLFLYFVILFVFFSFSFCFVFHLRFDFVLVLFYFFFFAFFFFFFKGGRAGEEGGGGEKVPVNQRAVTMTFL